MLGVESGWVSDFWKCDKMKIQVLFCDSKLIKVSEIEKMREIG